MYILKYVLLPLLLCGAHAFASSLRHGGKLWANELPKPYHFAAGLGMMQSLISQEGQGLYRLLDVDLFEEKSCCYKPYGSYSQNNLVLYVKKRPQHSVFNQESDLIAKSIGSKNVQESLFVQTSFRIPSQAGEHLILYKDKPVALEGRLLFASLWIHSQNYSHHMYLLFQRERKSIRVPLGRLLWQGWRRVFVKLPASMRNTTRLLKNSSIFYKGLQITAAASAKGEQERQLSLLIDRLLILAYQSKYRYPGAQMPDTW